MQEWKAGLFDVQDEGSQLAALLCDARPGMQVADICAGAGGKSLVMAAKMENKGRILALDPDAERLEKSGERLMPMPSFLKRSSMNLKSQSLATNSSA